MKQYSKLFSYDRAAHMRELHASGRYQGTSKIGVWNSSEEKRQRMQDIYARNALDKSSTGYGSELFMRSRNRELLHNKFQGETGFIYFLEYPGSIKVGFSRNWERRTTYELYPKKTYLAGNVLLIISGPTPELADLEYNTFIKFQNYTQLNSEGTRYTEFMQKSVKSRVRDFLLSEVKKNDNFKIEISNI